MQTVVLSTAYLGPVFYYLAIARSDSFFIEQFDSYHKQTYRNRCRIMAANGPIDLVIPVCKNSGQKTLVKDVVIDYATRWQSIHWRSILSAYNSSPFLEYYIDELAPFYHKPWKYLIDFNNELQLAVFDILGWEKTLERTREYLHDWGPVTDLREAFTPKKKFENGWKEEIQVYTQTFSEKIDFVPNLSIIDLIFNAGPQSKTILK